MLRKITNKEFVDRAKEVHGGKYDYSKVEYKKMHDKEYKKEEPEKEEEQ